MIYLKSVPGSLNITDSNCGYNSHIYFIVSVNTNMPWTPAKID